MNEKKKSRDVIKLINRFSGLIILASAVLLGIFTTYAIIGFPGIKHLFSEIWQGYLAIGVFIFIVFLLVSMGIKHFKVKKKFKKEGVKSRAIKTRKVKTAISMAFFSFLLVLSSGISYIFFSRFVLVDPSARDHFPYDVGPYLTWKESTATTITINWVTRENAGTRIAYGDDINNATWSIKSVSGETKLHRIMLDGLTPNTTYYYSILDFVDGSKVYQFKTSPEHGDKEPFKFAIFGDSQNGGGGYIGAYKNLTDAALQNGPYNFVIHVGDLVDQGNDLKSWNFSLSQVSRISSNCSFQSAVGNHDLGDQFMNDPDPDALNLPDAGANWEYFFDYDYVPKFAPIRSMRSRYVSYSYGNAYFIAVDTECTGDLEPGTNQITWLESELVEASSDPGVDWIICYFHRPVFCQYEGNGRDFVYFDEVYDHYKTLCPLFDRYGVDLVFQGHVHDYQAYNWTLNSSVPFYDGGLHDWTHHDTLYFVTGGAANELDSREQYDRNSQYMLGGQLTDHYMTVDIDNNTCTIQALYANNTLVQGNQSYTIIK
ncbi:MAG: purple acid phosphatase family protein [Candidatus Hodarchaeota archaeon]